MEWANEIFSERALNLKRSEIRELLKLTSRPGIISFAGGLPHPDTVNKEVMLKLAEHVISEHKNTALQYGQTEGIPELVKQLIQKAKLIFVKSHRKDFMVNVFFWHFEKAY